MRRSLAVGAVGVAVVLAAFSLSACEPDAVPAAPETAGDTSGPDAADPDAADPDTAELDAADPDAADPDAAVWPIAEPAGDVPALWSIVDPALGSDGDRDCSPYSLERDYLNGTLTLDDFTRYALFGPWDPESAPEQYRPCPDVNLLSTAGVFWGMQFVDYASPAVQEEVHTFLTPTFVPDEG